MKQADFARLCSLSQGRISQLKDEGLLVIDQNGVDALASLQRLKGHMQEARRRDAALRLIGAEPAAA